MESDAGITACFALSAANNPRKGRVFEYGSESARMTWTVALYGVAVTGSVHGSRFHGRVYLDRNRGSKHADLALEEWRWRGVFGEESVWVEALLVPRDGVARRLDPGSLDEPVRTSSFENARIIRSATNAVLDPAGRAGTFSTTIRVATTEPGNAIWEKVDGVEYE